MFIVINSPMENPEIKASFIHLQPFFGMPDLLLQFTLDIYCSHNYDDPNVFGRMYQSMVMFCEKATTTATYKQNLTTTVSSTQLDKHYTHTLYRIMQGMLDYYQRQGILNRIIPWIRSYGGKLRITTAQHNKPNPYIVCELI